MRLLSWNVNGYRAVCRKGFPDFLKKARADVLCLQETKCQPEQLSEDLLRHKGYEIEWHWGEKKGYCGVATFSKPKPLSVSRGLGLPEFDGEGRVLVHRYPEFTLLNVYFPNGKRDEIRLNFKMRFYEAFLRLLDSFRKRDEDKLVICGDVNTAHKEIDLARPKENRKVSGFMPLERAWLDRLVAEGFLDTFRQFEDGGGHYTWWDQLTRARERNVGWRIDYFFVSENLRPRLKKAWIMPEVLGSDHCPVGIELS